MDKVEKFFETTITLRILTKGKAYENEDISSFAHVYHESSADVTNQTSREVSPQ